MNETATLNERPSVSLVLGSGGARGLAHIGVIEWLEQHGFEIKSIAGSSMGALIGGIYSAGQLDVYSTWVRALEKIDVIHLLDLSFRRHSLFKGERIIETLKELIGDHTIEELPISYTAVATDLHNQKEIWIRHGPLFDAIRASIAIPTIFSPHRYMGKLLFDGSLVNPVPIAPTLNDKTDLTIAVDLNGAAQKEPVTTQLPPAASDNQSKKYHQRIAQFIAGLSSKSDTVDRYDMSFFDIISKSMEIMQGRITRQHLAVYHPDATISIPINACTSFEFYRADELIELGWEKAEAGLAGFINEQNGDLAP